VLEAATRHYRAWIGQKPPKELGERVAAWAGAEPGGWPPLDSVEPDGPWPALLAFSLAAALPDPEQRKRACEGVAKVLGR
jgi:hypothetical protein